MNLQTLVESAKENGHRLTELKPEQRSASPDRHAFVSLKVDPRKTFQTLEGFGGALTESSGWVLDQLPPALRAQALRSYFDPVQGLGYVLARTHMNSCDFSLGNWACCEQKDETLATFSMEKTEAYLVPLIKEAMAAAGGSLKLMVSPWSPPGWMKDNGEMNHGGKLLKKYYPLWAQYFVRFLSELEKRGVPVWSVTVQNEPAAVQRWDSCIYTAEEEGEFVARHLGPAFRKAGIGALILAWDHNRDLLWDRMEKTMGFPGAEEYLAGAAFHWYSGDQYGNLDKFREAYPEKRLIFSEGCVEGGPRPGAWFTGERYAHNIINDLNHGTQGWIDWNIVLDTTGGPNHVGNLCDAPILADLRKGELHYQSSYYALGHFSRYFKPGSRRIEAVIESGMVPANVDGRIGNTMETTAVRNPDGSLALVVTNRTEADMVYTLEVAGSGGIQTLVCPPRGIQTLLLKP